MLNRCLSLLNPNSGGGEWTITSVLHDATAVAGTGIGAMLSAVHGFNTGIPYRQNRVKGPKWLPFLVGLPPLLLFSGTSAAFGEWCSRCKNSGEIYGSLSSPLCLCIKFMVLGVLFVRHHVVVPKRVVDLLACWKGFLVVIILQKCRYMGCYPTMYYVDYCAGN